MNKQSNCTGLLIYFNKDYSKDIDSLYILIKSLCKVSSSINKIYGMYSQSDKFTRTKKFNEKNLKELLEMAKKGTLDQISLEEKYSDIDLPIGINIEFGKRSYVPKIKAYKSHNLQIDLITKKSSRLFENYLNLLKKKITDLDFQYGIASTANNYLKLHEELNASIYGFFDPKNPDAMFIKTEKEKRKEKELIFYQNLDEYDKYIRRAYWANFLNPTHVKKIGGIEKIKKECPVFLVEELPGGNIYIQLTEKIEDFGTNKYYKKLKILDNFLKPIKHPDCPDPIFTSTNSSKQEQKAPSTTSTLSAEK